MQKTSVKTFDIKQSIVPLTVCVVFFLAILWQGAYFSVQYIFLLAVPFAAFALYKRAVSITLDALLLLGLVAVMLLSLVIKAKEPGIAFRELLRYLLMPSYLLFFLAAKEKSHWYMKAFFAAIFTIALLGLLAYAGGIEIPSGIIQQSGRLQSTIQYANTTALFMLIGILYSLHYFLTTKQLRYPIYAVLFAFCLYITGSRTTLLLAFIIAIVYALTKMKRTSRFILLAVLFLSAIGLFVIGGRIVRVSLTEPTFIERVITWQDGLIITAQSPLFGLGIGNWQFEQFLYQSAPYGVRYIHNYYIQLLMDGGVLSALLFIAVIANTLWRGRKENSIHLFIILAIVLHIFMDFDMSFGGIILILMFSLSQMPDKGIFSVPCKKKPLRLFALVSASILIFLWVSEFKYIVPDPLGEKFSKSEIQAENKEYLPAIENMEYLLQAWRFNESYQQFYESLLIDAFEEGVISAEERQQKLILMEESSAVVNSLYTKYIAGQ